MPKKATKVLVSMYEEEITILELMVKNTNDDPLQDREVDRSKVIRALIQGGMRRFKISKAELTEAMEAKAKALQTRVPVVN